MEELAEAQGRLTSSVGELQRPFGATVQEEAASVVEVMMRRKGFRVLQPAIALALDSEVDVVLPLEDSASEPVWVVVEAKACLSRSDIQAWSQRLHSAGWHNRLAEKGCGGPYLVYAHGIRAELGAQELAAKEGIGLLKSDEEILAPKEPINPIT